MNYTMVHKETGNTVVVKEGWSWVSFLFGCVALFFRGQIWVALIVLFIGIIFKVNSGIFFLIWKDNIFFSFVLSFFLGLKSNAYRIEMLRQKGYVKR